MSLCIPQPPSLFVERAMEKVHCRVQSFGCIISYLALNLKPSTDDRIFVKYINVAFSDFMWLTTIMIICIYCDCSNVLVALSHTGGKLLLINTHHHLYYFCSIEQWSAVY